MLVSSARFIARGVGGMIHGSENSKGNGKDKFEGLAKNQQKPLNIIL